MEAVIAAITNVGFPIVMCLLMFYMNEKQDERHREEISEVTTAVNNNTLVLQQVLDSMKGAGTNGE